MTTNEFFAEARQKISKNPYSRLAAPARAAVAQPDCVFDIHCHIFDKKCLDIKYLALRMALHKVTGLFGLEAAQDIENQLIVASQSEEDIYANLEKDYGGKDSKNDWSDFDKELQIIDDNSDLIDGLELFGFSNKGLTKSWNVLKKGSMEEVFRYYLHEFSLQKSSFYANRPFVTGILSMDLEMGWGIKPEKTLSEQIDELKALSTEYAILPFFAIDPRRADKEDKDENLYELFLKAFCEADKPSFFGVKCYPALGYFPSDERLRAIFQICEEKNIPITTHCGGEVVSTFEKSVEFVGKNAKEIIPIAGLDRRDRAKFLNNPLQWLPVLKEFPKLRINFAHFGGDTNWENKSKNLEHTVIQQIMDICVEYNTFADFSFNVIEKELFAILNDTLNKHPEVRNKTLFGTDFWVVLPSGDLWAMQEEFLITLAAHRDALVSDNPRKFLFGESKADDLEKEA